MRMSSRRLTIWQLDWQKMALLIICCYCHVTSELRIELHRSSNLCTALYTEQYDNIKGPVHLQSIHIDFNLAVMKGTFLDPRNVLATFCIAPLMFIGIKSYLDILAVVWHFSLHFFYITLQNKETMDIPLGVEASWLGIGLFTSTSIRLDCITNKITLWIQKYFSTSLNSCTSTLSQWVHKGRGGLTIQALPEGPIPLGDPHQGCQPQ